MKNNISLNILEGIETYSPGKNKSGKFGTDKTLSKDQYEALDYYLDWAKLYDSGFYLQQDKEGNDYFIDAEAGGEKLSLEDGLYIVYESLGDPTDLPDDVLEGLQSLFKQYLNIDFFDDFGIKIKKNKKKKAKMSESADIDINNLRPKKEYFIDVCNFLNNTDGLIKDYQVKELLNMLADGMGFEEEFFDKDITPDMVKTLSDNVENDEGENFLNNLISYLKIKSNK